VDVAAGRNYVRTFLVWVLSEAIGALALVPLGLLFKPHYLLRHRDPRLLLETLTTLAVTLSLSWQPSPGCRGHLPALLSC
jgi:integral membrane sensor domain MASE1